jgi:hypothetical protein
MSNSPTAKNVYIVFVMDERILTFVIVCQFYCFGCAIGEKTCQNARVRVLLKQRTTRSPLLVFPEIPMDYPALLVSVIWAPNLLSLAKPRSLGTA